MHVLLHLGNGHLFAGATCDLLVLGAAAAIALRSHSSSYQVRVVPRCCAALRRVRFSAFYANKEEEALEGGCPRFCWVLLVPYSEKGHISALRLTGTICPSGAGAPLWTTVPDASESMLKCELRPALSTPDVHRITTCAVFTLRYVKAGLTDRLAQYWRA
jgi:hypothetical protein